MIASRHLDFEILALGKYCYYVNSLSLYGLSFLDTVISERANFSKSRYRSSVIEGLYLCNTQIAAVHLLSLQALN